MSDKTENAIFAELVSEAIGGDDFALEALLDIMEDSGCYGGDRTRDGDRSRFLATCRN